MFLIWVNAIIVCLIQILFKLFWFNELAAAYFEKAKSAYSTRFFVCPNKTTIEMEAEGNRGVRGMENGFF